MPAPDDTMTLKEVAKTFKVNRKTIARWCERGLFPKPIDCHGEQRWLASEVQAHQVKLIVVRETQSIMLQFSASESAQVASGDGLSGQTGTEGDRREPLGTSRSGRKKHD